MRTHVGREPVAVTTLDLVLLVAGFACGLVLRPDPALGHGRVYILPSGTATFRSSLGGPEAAWLWALAPGLAFAVLARRFRYGGIFSPAEWLAVSLAIFLVDSAFPAMRRDRATSSDGEIVWVDWSGNGAPVALNLWTPHTAECREYLMGVAARLTIAASLVATAAWVLRSKLGRGWVPFLVVAIAALVALGPIRLGEAMSSEVTSFAPIPGFRPHGGERAWTRRGLSLYLDVRAWAGYTPRALWLSAVAISTAAGLAHRGRRRPWTEWAAIALSTILACLWARDEFAARPAFDRPTRAVALLVWLLVLVLLARLPILARTALRRRVRGPGPVPGRPRPMGACDAHI